MTTHGLRCDGVISFFDLRNGLLNGGPIASDDRWLYEVTEEGYLLVFNREDLDTGCLVENLSQVEHHGPAAVGYTVRYGFNVRDIALFRSTLIIAGTRDLFPFPGGVLLALNVSDPTSITENPATLKLLYNLSFQGGIGDILLKDSTLYLLEDKVDSVDEFGVLHIFDLSSTPPVERVSVRIAPEWSLDVQGSLLAMVGGNRNALSLYTLAGDNVTFAQSFTLPGIPASVTLGNGRVYVDWFREQDYEPWVSVLSLPGLTSLGDVPLDREHVAVGNIVLRDDDAYLVSSQGSAILRPISLPVLATNVTYSAALAGLAVAAAVAHDKWRPPKTGQSGLGSFP